MSELLVIFRACSSLAGHVCRSWITTPSFRGVGGLALTSNCAVGHKSDHCGFAGWAPAQRQIFSEGGAPPPLGISKINSLCPNQPRNRAPRRGCLLAALWQAFSRPSAAIRAKSGYKRCVHNRSRNYRNHNFLLCVPRNTLYCTTKRDRHIEQQCERRRHKKPYRTKTPL